MDNNGNQEAKLEIAADKNKADKTFKCKVISSAYPDSSAASEVTAAINVYGMLIQALDLSTFFCLEFNNLNAYGNFHP